MADMSKAEKLAAARRKLKEYQKKSKDTPNPDVRSNPKKDDSKSPPLSEATDPYQQNYVFDSGSENSPLTELKEYQEKSKDMPNSDVKSNLKKDDSNSPPISEATQPFQQSYVFDSGPGNSLSTKPEVPIAELNGVTEELQPPVFAGMFASDGRDFFDNLPSQPVADDVMASEMPECDIRNQNVHLEDSLISSSTESLRQLSLQMNGLIDESGEPSGSGSTELEKRNQELAAMLAEKEQKWEQLQLQVKEYQSRVSQLQVDMSQLQAESETKLARELHPVQEQLQLHIQTVGILVGEKTELQAALNKSHQTAKQKAVEVEELQGRLKVSRQKITELEKELSALTSMKDQLEEPMKELELVKSDNSVLKNRLEESYEEVSEMRQKLSSRANECVSLQQEVQEKQSQIDLLQLKVQQLSTCDRPDADHLLEAMHQQKVALEWQVSELQQTVKSLSVDREQATQQYQDYLQQFNAQLKNMADKLAATTAENEQLMIREQSLVHHVSELEKQLQTLQLHRSKEEPQNTERLRELENQVTTLQANKQEMTNQLEGQLQEKAAMQSELEEATKRIEELEAMVDSLQADQPDKNRLLAAMESDKVAAAQAVGQNQKLKTQLEELQDSFVKMSNDKMELTAQLQHEQHVSRELEEKLVRLKEKLRNEVEAKERAIEMSSKTKLLETELEQARFQIEDLSVQNFQFHVAEAKGSPSEIEHNIDDGDVAKNNYISMKEAMEKLEQRFTKTMQEVAELTEEKQRLEHIVVQLQGETETIGEYIALYQVQRSLLRERAKEKDEQLVRLRRDREDMRAKLNELTNLIQKLMANKQEEPSEEKADSVQSQELVNGIVEKPEEQKIMALLSDISSSTLVEPLAKGSEGFHPCPWCSGRLITV